MQVDILTPKKKVFSGKANEVRAPGWEGEFGVLPGHDLFLTLLRGGVLTVVYEGDTRFVVGRGFVEVGNDVITVLTDLAEPVGAYGKEAAGADAAAAESKMAGLDGWSLEYAKAEEQLEIARARQIS